VSSRESTSTASSSDQNRNAAPTPLPPPTKLTGTSPASTGSNAAIIDTPATPGGFSVCATNDGAQVVWNSVTYAASYNVYYSTTSGKEMTGSGTKQTFATSPYPVTGLTNGTTYYFQVTAINSIGESAPTTESSAVPTASIHDSLVVGVTNTNSVYFYDCYSQLGSSVSSPTRTLTLPAGTQAAGEGGIAVDQANNWLYVATTASSNGGEILVYHNAGTLSGSASVFKDATEVLYDATNATAPSPAENVDGIVLDTVNHILYADSFGYFTFYTSPSDMTGRVPFHDSTFGTTLGHGSQMAVDTTGTNPSAYLYLGQRSTVSGNAGVWNVSVFASSLKSTSAPASGWATMPTPTKQITLASPDTFNTSVGTLALAIDTSTTNGTLYVSGSNSTNSSNVFSMALNTAGTGTTVTNAIVFPSISGALYGPDVIGFYGNELWTLGPSYVYDITSANNANGTVGTSLTPARTTNAGNDSSGGIVYVP
jgi:hypothetical protein